MITCTVFRMHEISCGELRWFVLVSTAKLQYNPKIMPRKNFFLRPQEEFASCSWLRVAWALVLETCLLSKTVRRPGRKNISGYIWHKSFIQTVKCSFFNQITVYQSFYGALLMFSIVTFYLEEKFCVSARVGKSQLRDVYRSKAFRRPCRKNYISGYIWHKSFIQTVKCSFFNQIVVYQSFYGASLLFSNFLLQGKVVFRTRRQVACEMFIVYCEWMIKAWFCVFATFE